MREVALTTIDNKYDPITESDDWHRVDEIEKGYYTDSYLARCVKISNAMSEEQEREAIEAAIDEIVRINPLGLYKKVVHDDNKQ